MRRTLAGCMLLVAALSSRAVAAEEPRSAAAEEASGHFQRGAQFFRENNLDAALAAFTRAYEVLPNFRVLYNIGQVQAGRHDYIAAIRAFDAYLEQGGTDLPEERRTQVQAEITSLRQKISPLTVTCNVAGAELRIDGVVAGSLPLQSPIEVNAGLRRVTVTKPGYSTAERNVLVAGRQDLNVNVTLEAVRSQLLAPRVSAPPPTSERGGNPGLWFSVTATGVFAAGAAAFGIMTLQRDQDLDRELERYPADRQKVADLRDSIRLNAALTDGFAAASGASALLAVYFLVSNRSEPDRTRAQLLVGPRQVAVTGSF